MRRAILIPLLLVCGCVASRRAALEGDGLDATARRDAAAAAAAPGASAGHAPSWADALTGHWRYDHVGNCIMAEEWWSFGADQAFTHTIVDRDACDPESHGVAASRGTFAALPNRVLSLRWETAGGTAFSKTRTVAIVDPPQGSSGPTPDHARGRRGLNHEAYSGSDGGRAWHREARDVQRGPEPTALRDAQTVVDVAFDAPLAAAPGAGARAMTVTIAVVVALGAGEVHRGRETFVLPCRVAAEPDAPWLRIAAEGFEQSTVDGRWMDRFTDQGIWDRYPAVVSNALYDAFRPVMFFSPADGGVLLHRVHFAWLAQMDTAPPASLDEPHGDRR